jgi:hypothetical protein
MLHPTFLRSYTPQYTEFHRHRLHVQSMDGATIHARNIKDIETDYSPKAGCFEDAWDADLLPEAAPACAPLSGRLRAPGNGEYNTCG